MNRFLRRADKRVSLGSAAFLLASSTMIGTILGMLRTRLIGNNFNRFSTDAYIAAFRIPDFVFFALASGALTVAFLPYLSDKLSKGTRKEAWELTSYVLNFLAIISLAFSIILIIFAEPIMKLFGFPDDQLSVAAAVMRFVAINPFVFSVSTLLSSTQQAVGRFFFFAIAPLFYNISIIVSVYIFRDSSVGIVGVGMGVAIGAILQLVIIGFGMLGMNFTYFPKINFKNKDFKSVMRALPARSVDQGMDYINTIVETKFAAPARLGTGAITNYEFALSLHNAPIMLIGTAISTAAFPRFTERISQGRPDLFRKEFLIILRTMIWIVLPIAVIAYFCRGYLSRLVYARENREIAIIFGYLVAAIVFRTLYSIISRYFYAKKDNLTPLFVSIFSIIFNIVLAYNLSRPSAYGVAGLAIAQSVVAVVEVIILLTVMVARDRKLFDLQFIRAITRIFSISGLSMVVAFVMTYLLPFVGDDKAFITLVKLAIISLVVLGFYLALSWLFDLEETKPIFAKIKKIVLKPIKI